MLLTVYGSSGPTDMTHFCRHQAVIRVSGPRALIPVSRPGSAKCGETDKACQFHQAAVPRQCRDVTCQSSSVARMMYATDNVVEFVTVDKVKTNVIRNWLILTVETVVKLLCYHCLTFCAFDVRRLE